MTSTRLAGSLLPGERHTTSPYGLEHAFLTPHGFWIASNITGFSFLPLQIQICISRSLFFRCMVGGTYNCLPRQEDAVCENRASFQFLMTICCYTPGICCWSAKAMTWFHPSGLPRVWN